MPTFIVNQPTKRQLIQTLSRLDILASSINAAVKLNLAEIVSIEEPIAINELYKKLLDKNIIKNPDNGPFIRLLKFLSCYGVFNVNNNIVSHSSLSKELLKENVITLFSGLNDQVWRAQGDFLIYLKELPEDASVFLNQTSTTININQEGTHFVLTSDTDEAMLVELANLQLMSRAIYAAADINLFDLLKQREADLPYLVDKTNTDSEALEKCIAILKKYQFLTENNHKYALASSALPLTDGDNSNSIKPAVLMANKPWWNAIGYLYHCVQTGNVPYIAINGLGVFEYLESHKDERLRFDRGLANSDADQDYAVANADFEIKDGMSFVDIGGGNGGLITGLLEKHPGVKEAILFDQPETIKHLSEKAALVKSQKTSDYHSQWISRCVLQPGNFLISENNGLPVGKDLYIIKGVLHDFSDEDVTTIFKNVAKAMSKDSVFKIIERYLTDDNQPDFNKIGDMQMMAFFAAKERSLSDYQQLAEKAGLKLDVGSSQSCGNYTIIDARRQLVLEHKTTRLSENPSPFFKSAQEQSQNNEQDIRRIEPQQVVCYP